MRLVGNLPYNISTPLLFHLARYADRVRDMHFMLQHEVVERMVAAHSTPAYGRLSVALQTRFRMQKLFKVSKGAFRPPPKVESAVVRMEPLAEPSDLGARPSTTSFAAPFLRAASSCATPCPWQRPTSRSSASTRAARPENLSPADYVRIARHLREDADS